MLRSLASLFRLARAAWVLARHDALLPAEYQDKLPRSARLLGRLARLIARPQANENPGARLARALEALGPAHIKLGQFLASRPDVVGAALADGLGGLRDQLAPAPRRAAEAALEDAFGEDWRTHFSAFGPAIAAASVAQAHRARTADGRDVAVKILRPGIEAEIARDIHAFRLGAHLIETVAPTSRRLGPVAFIETLSASLERELDLRLEAAAAAEMDEIAAQIEGFAVPAVDWDATSRRVMTLDWVDAIKLTDDAALTKAGIDRAALAVIAIRAFLTSALDHGVFHADMHEGNLFARADNTLVAVDFGIVGRIGADERRYLAEILYGFLNRDYTRVAEVHFEAGYVPAKHSVADFAGALRAVGEPIFGRGADKVSMARVLLQLFEITELFEMALRPELVLLQKTMVQVEGTARNLDPNFDMWEASRPIVERWMRRALGPEAMIGQLAKDAGRIQSSLRRLPTALEQLTDAAERIGSDGMRLDDDTLARLARAQANATRGRSVSSWVLALSAAALAGAAVATALGG